MLDGTELRAGDVVTEHAHGIARKRIYLGYGSGSGRVYLAEPVSEMVHAVALTDEHWIADPKTDRAYTFSDPEALYSGTPDQE